ncbi:MULTISPECIES: hypothetical protein [unclassified Gilliamella]|uniref:hypothetical protein n=1 Tax=unclassified Gilliamella TaxID=2685620 RepID=UPI002269A45E|nr:MULTISPECIES: hypothetical protein [unclassified Gilliamella]MCX8575141.1 hypothetical protein [Gilliamella sp. B3831]MCX8577523.1 hypothetical protein [Gilliamella sp. B3815]MCX8590611.1 hypothetical protein [Gilliamella sp. B3812]MCX8604473.1 hypothetical protein [Gilliamella sp. B3823]MCX8606167.1 hypothetical protein [Gilliamella sp. B3825]
MSKAEIEAHLAKFDDDAVRFTSKAKYEQYGTYGKNNGFVMPASEFNQLMKEANSDLRIVEKKLGLEDGYLSNSDCMAVYIPKSEFKNYHLVMKEALINFGNQEVKHQGEFLKR